jgi:hypothetical protein
MLLTVGMVALPGLLPAQTSSSAREAEVRQAVETFVTDLENLDYHKVAATLTPRALVVIVRERQGTFVTTTLSRDEWLASLWGNPSPARFEEPLSNLRVTIDSDHLAHVRADFRILQNGVQTSSGVDQFTLVREATAWKVAAVAFTSVPTTR